MKQAQEELQLRQIGKGFIVYDQESYDIVNLIKPMVISIYHQTADIDFVVHSI